MSSRRLESPLLQSSYRSRRRLLDLVRYLGRLYDNDIEGVDQFVKFQEILDLIDSNKTTGIYNAREVLTRLAPKCDDYLLKCKWGGQFYNCSDLLELRRTSEGSNIVKTKNCFDKLFPQDFVAP